MNSYIYVPLCIILTSMGQLFLKIGARGKNNIRSMFLNPYAITGYVLLAVVTVCAVLALNSVDLKLFYALMSLNYVVVILLSNVILNEPLSYNKIVATSLIVIGIIVFNM
jgi:multidrug transporter EmrE-like cation transporter